MCSLCVHPKKHGAMHAGRNHIVLALLVPHGEESDWERKKIKGRVRGVCNEMVVCCLSPVLYLTVLHWISLHVLKEIGKI